MTSVLISVTASCLGAVWILACAWGAGEGLLRRVGVSWNSALERSVMAAGLGLGFLAYGVYALGLLGWLTRPVLFTLLILVSLLGTGHAARQGRAVWVDLKGALGQAGRLELILAGAAALLALIGALVPETGQDALSYHLFLPKTFLEQNRIAPIPLSRESLWPLLVEMDYVLALALGGAGTAKLLHWAVGLLFALGLFAFSRRFLSDRSAFRAGALFLLTPVVFMEQTTAYIDLGFGWFAFLAAVCLWNWLESRRRSWLGLAGVFLGLTLSTKYLGLLVLGVLVPAAALFPRNLRIAERARGAAFLAGIACLVGGVWYLRAFLWTGNPVYPFFAERFGGAGWQGYHLDLAGSGRSLAGLSALPWNVTMHPAAFGSGEQIGPLWLALLPVAWMIARGRVYAFATAVVIGYLILWFFVGQMIRFLLPALPWAAFLAAGALEAAEGQWSEWPRRLVRAAVTVTLAAFVGLAGYYNLPKGKLLAGRQSPQDYLVRTERSFSVWDWINRNLDPAAKILVVNETRRFYADRATTLVVPGSLAEAAGRGGEASLEGLRARYGCTHVLEAKALRNGRIVGTPLSLERGSLEIVRTWEREAPDGFVYEYTLLKPGQT